MSLVHGTAQEKPFRLRQGIPRSPAQSCGLDALYVGLHSLGVDDISLQDLEKRLRPGPKGVSLEKLRETSEEVGTLATLVHGELDSLAQSGNPTILHVNDNHFVLLLAREAERLVLFDNGTGLFDCTEELFARYYRWNGAALILGPPPPRVVFSLYAPAFGLLLLGGALLILTLRSFRTSEVSRDSIKQPSP